ncbi:MAG TPA: 3-methyl-2-oxobutanoate hydroxymethyltransferase [Nitrospiria bacterium]|jgi:3-methyl-2-oxobutanoate hydroxymethyltransferase
MTGKITIPELAARKKAGEKISMLTAYDFPFAQMVDEAGIDVILVGDSLGVVVQGHENTLQVTMDQMIYHTQMVSRGVQRAMVIGDMPYLSFQISLEETLRNAGRFIQEGGAHAVKLEGGERVVDRIEALVKMDIPVLAHLGLTPQSIHQIGGYKVQGKEPHAAQKIMDNAKRVEGAGAFAVILETVPMNLAKRITENLSIPTIGIGAGIHCDGQVLVLHDILGLFQKFFPKFVKRYADLRTPSLEAFKRFKEDVESGRYPSDEESYH